jgi:hypothetical protein
VLIPDHDHVAIVLGIEPPAGANGDRSVCGFDGQALENFSFECSAVIDYIDVAILAVCINRGVGVDSWQRRIKPRGLIPHSLIRLGSRVFLEVQLST